MPRNQSVKKKQPPNGPDLGQHPPGAAGITARPQPSPSAAMVPLDQLAILLGSNVPELTKLSKRGILPPIVKGEMPQARTINLFAKWLRNPLMTREEVAAEFSVTKAWLGQLVIDGFIPTIDDFVPLRDAYKGWVRWHRDDSRRVSKSAAEQRVRDARAAEIEVRTQERLGKLVSTEDFFEMIEGMVGVFRSEIGGLPARVTRDLTVRRAIEREVHEVLSRIHLRANETADRLEAGRQITEAVAADDAGRVGGVESDVPG